MARSRKTERRYLSEEEISLLDKTHFPELRNVQSPDLLKLRKRLREIRETAGNSRKLLQPGVAQPKAIGAPQEADGTGSKMRRDILSAAVKRVNREIERRRTAGMSGHPEGENSLNQHA
ncbi:hypothetical protein [Rhodoligotrophos ferricapiens]|uniref:hypothetical protein n=1 Tax=Rhodoligotrophos ferricapiens TaxID=3069264 RepID=UPI00315D2126